LIQPAETQQAQTARLTPSCPRGFADATLRVGPGEEGECASMCSLL
jgi:hypothetical protein